MNTSMCITSTSLILLRTTVKGKRREILTTPERGDLHTELGVLHLGELVGKSWGEIVLTHLGHPFAVLKPRAPDIFKHLPRSGAPLMPKDIANIVAHTGLSKEDVVLEAGTGSGVLTVYLSRIARHVTSYEVRRETFEATRKSLDRLGIRNVTLHNKDLLEELPQIKEEFDVVILDMPESHRALPQIMELLRSNGYLVVYTPYLEHARLVHDRLVGKATELKTVEVFEREIRFEEKGTRPATQRVGHTGYLTYAQKGISLNRFMRTFDGAHLSREER